MDVEGELVSKVRTNKQKNKKCLMRGLNKTMFNLSGHAPIDYLVGSDEKKGENLVVRVCNQNSHPFHDGGRFQLLFFFPFSFGFLLIFYLD